MKTLFRSLGFIFTVLFFISSILQYNDPDPFVWMVIWGVASIIALGFTLDQLPFQIIFAGSVLALIGFFCCYPEKFEGFEIEAGNIKNVEEGREAFGLLIIALVLFAFAWRSWYTEKLKV